MEFSVYDGPGKRVRLAIFGALVAGMVASFTTVFLASQGAAARGGGGLPERFPIFVIPAVLIALLTPNGIGNTFHGFKNDFEEQSMIRLITGLIGWVFGVLLVYVAGWGETRLVNVAVPLMSGFIAIFLAEAYKKRRPKF